MAAAFRAKTKLCPVLETQYTPYPRKDTTLTKYIPGVRRNNVFNKDPRKVTYNYIIQTSVTNRTYTVTLLECETDVGMWDLLRTEVFELYGNIPVIYGKLIGLRHISSNIVYLFGQLLPLSGGTFVPIVSYS
jgi:hypothetical protein